MGSSENEDARIRMMHGGPFWELMSRLGLRKRGWRAVVFATLCWVVPVWLQLATGGGYVAGLFLHDWGAWAKFLIAPVLLTLAEKPIGFALDECASIMFRIPLVASQSMPEALKGLRDARARTTAGFPELVCLAIAVAASGLNAASFLSGTAPGWAISNTGLSMAGIWCVVFSNTVYWFLLARLIWKHLVWAGFLSGIGRCHLRLAVTHPDGHGGLGFVGFYPAGGALFTLAASSVAAASIGHVMQRQTVTPTLFTVVCAAWLAIVLAYYAFPLVGLSGKIARVKQKAMMLSLAKATDFERRMESIVMGENVFPDEAETDATDVKDVKPIYQASLKTSALLIDKSNVLSVLVPALLPLLVVGASYLPYSQLGPIMKRLLLL